MNWRTIVEDTQCLSHRSIAAKRHHNQGTSYERKYLNGSLLTISEV